MDNEYFWLWRNFLIEAISGWQIAHRKKLSAIRYRLYAKKVVMIKSRVLSSLNNQTGLNWGLVFIGIAVSVFLRGLIFSEPFTTPLEAFIWYPVLVFTGLLFVQILVRKLFGSWVVFESRVLPIAGIFTIFVGFLTSLLPFWGRSAAGMPLSLSQIVTYILTLGVYPFPAGPDGFLRGIAWVVGIILAIYLYKDTKDLFRSIFLAILSWAAMTLVFLMPSLFLMITMAFSSLPFATSGAEMVGEFTRLNLFSYWGDGQLLRWFTGFGGQATNALLLYTASWIFILGGLFWTFLNFGLVKQLVAGFKISWGISAVTIVLFGYLAGTSHQGWIGLDAAAWGVFAVVLFLGWLYQRTNSLSIALPDASMLILWMLGLMLLGWPVLLGGLLFLSVLYCKDQIKTLNVVVKWQWIIEVFSPTIMVLFFVLFMRRGVAMDPVMLQVVFIFSLFSLLAGFIGFAKRVNFKNLWMIIGWIVIAGLLWIVTGVFSPAAIMLLVGVFMWLFWQKITQYSWDPEILVWCVAIVVLLVVIWLPRLAHPELIPR